MKTSISQPNKNKKSAARTKPKSARAEPHRCNIALVISIAVNIILAVTVVIVAIFLNTDQSYYYKINSGFAAYCDSSKIIEDLRANGASEAQIAYRDFICESLEDESFKEGFKNYLTVRGIEIPEDR
jgi:hypothetical protein